jgi:group II intron reverse transcriptase/maturase
MTNNLNANEGNSEHLLDSKQKQDQKISPTAPPSKKELQNLKREKVNAERRAKIKAIRTLKEESLQAEHLKNEAYKNQNSELNAQKIMDIPLEQIDLSIPILRNALSSEDKEFTDQDIKIPNVMEAINKAKETLIKRGMELVPNLKVTYGIYNRNVMAALGNLPPPVHDELYSLLTDEKVFIIAYDKLKSNTGATTPGPKGQSADSFSIEDAKELAHQFKTNTFKWSPFKRTFIAKPGAKPDPVTGNVKKRPLGMPDFTDKLVQETIRLILHCIYDPWFEIMDCSFGFRPFTGCHQALKNVYKKGQSMDFAIEGDTKGAFDNVNPDIMNDILSLRIKDKKFLNLIRQGFLCGLFEEGVYKDTFLGTPQGGIASPILYNIYTLELDKFVEQEIKTIQNSKTTTHQNSLGNMSIIELNKTIRTMQTRIRRAKKALEKGPISEITRKNYEEAVEKLPSLLKQKLLQNDLRLKKPLRVSYTRYADDWIILTNGSYEFCVELKQKIANMMSEKLKLTLSDEKTKITDIRKDKAKFLGFTIHRKAYKRAKRLTISYTQYQKHPNRVFHPDASDDTPSDDEPPTNQELKPNTKNFISYRNTTRALKIGIDYERILSRFETKRYCTHAGHPREAPHLSVLPSHDIIIGYNAVIMGLFNYYYPIISYKAHLNRLHYILYYSCLKTLAQRLRQSMAKITTNNRYKDISLPRKGKLTHQQQRIVFKYTDIPTTKNKNKNNKPIEKRVVLLNYEEAVSRMRAILFNQKITKIRTLQEDNTHNFLTAYKRYWRTQFKLSTCCLVCGITPEEGAKIQNHHIRHIKKSNRTTGFSRIMGLLNRKQIPLCKACHDNVHHGKYNGLALEDLHDELIKVAISEPLINDNQTPTSKEASKKYNTDLIKWKQDQAYFFNDKERTITSRYTTKINSLT